MNKQNAEHVFLDYDQERLDLNYNQSAWAANASEIIAWYRAASLAAHQRLGCRSLTYGCGGFDRIDLFCANEPGAPLVVYVHGGAWRTLDRLDSAFAAEAFVAAGVNFAVLDFASIPDARLPDMVRQVQRGIGWLSDHAAELGCDANQLLAIGHSSGAHLVASALTAETDSQIAPGMVKAAMCASGSYDLEGAMLSARGAYLKLSNEEVHMFSPMRHLKRISCPLAVAYGEAETDEYCRQARALHAGLVEAGKPADLLLVQGQNHFEVSQTLADRDGILFREAMKLLSNL
ncbi:alpha/beta hydrolase [Aminobacter carboxidus]|uniref:Alpha/beta hydrolase n=1 Tax=Aminobacter carboxidus TaxID=376165 RepID=A0ABR9GW74_9HYPH|nr:alpha/beta hydrolase [Aminobacter carboxidus]MBE1207935.1 alpha/beta hydrolase [Aminobacter carboxidus]